MSTTNTPTTTEKRATRDPEHWQREGIKRMTMDEIQRALGYDFEIVERKSTAAIMARKRRNATRRLCYRLAGCAVAWVGVFAAKATGDMSDALALILTGAVLAVSAFCLGVWTTYMKCKGGWSDG